MKRTGARIAVTVLALTMLVVAGCGGAREASPSPAGETLSPAVAGVTATDEFATSPVLTLTPESAPTNSPTPTPTDSPTPTPTLPPVGGPDPSYRVAAFYYPWYRNAELDGAWRHWDEPIFDPPLSISSDFYPVLGAYSSLDRAVVAQHFAWLREAGVGVIVSSWWGRRSIEEKAVPLLLEMGERYGIKVAFHLEPYGGRTARTLVSDVEYLYRAYGAHPAFFRTTEPSRWSPDDRPKGLFFLWASRYSGLEQPPVQADYWQEAMDTIHGLPDGGLVLADEIGSGWAEAGHFDGSYSYALLGADEAAPYRWARGLPPGTWFVPGVNPGFSAVRIGYEASTYVAREDGAAYDLRWEALLNSGVEPNLVTITTFNEWHEGTQIEPAAVGMTNGRGYTYEDYGRLPPEGYLIRTHDWVVRFEETQWPATYRARVRFTTTSDWTTVQLVRGATWLRPSLVEVGKKADSGGLDQGFFSLGQPLARAEAGKQVEVTFDLLLSPTQAGGPLAFRIERGHLGSTQVALFNYLGPEPVHVRTLEWGGIQPQGPNAETFEVPRAVLFKPVP
jgi:glycoprotein endo-alpha-1,2-mannosidase